MKPRFKITIVTILLLIAISSTVIASQPKDIESSHWAYQSVKELLEKGYLSVYPDNTFRGNEPVDRYTLANVVARMLREVQTGKVTASSEDIASLKKLYTEYQDEVVKAFQEIDKLNSRVTDLEKGLVANKDEITRLQIDYNNSFKPEIAKQIEAVFASMNTTKTQLEGKLDSLKLEVDLLKGDKASSKDLDKAISSAVQRAADEAIAVKLDLQDENTKLKEEVDALKTTLTGYIQSFVDVTDKVAKLEGQLNLLDNQIREDLQSTRSSNFVRERTIENRLEKIEEELKSTKESTNSRLSSLEGSRYYWWAGFGLSIITVIVALVAANNM